jgi:hypothetical protein
METLELPSIEERDEILSQPQVPPVNFAEQEIDLAAFRLWQQASRLDSATEE